MYLVLKPVLIISEGKICCLQSRISFIMSYSKKIRGNNYLNLVIVTVAGFHAAVDPDHVIATKKQDYPLLKF